MARLFHFSFYPLLKSVLYISPIRLWPTYYGIAAGCAGRVLVFASGAAHAQGMFFKYNVVEEVIIFNLLCNAKVI